MSPLVLVPVLVLALGAWAVAGVARRLTTAIVELDEVLTSLAQLEHARAGLATEVETVAGRDFFGARHHR